MTSGQRRSGGRIPERLTAVELCIGEQLDKVAAISRLYIVPLKVTGNVAECLGVAVNVKGADAARFFILPDLLLEELREIRGRWYASALGNQR